MAQLVGRRYADALFFSAEEDNILDRLYEEVIFLRRFLFGGTLNGVRLEADGQELVTVLNNPGISKADKMKLLSAVFSGRVSETLIGFFDLVLRKNREDNLLSICDLFIAKVRKSLNITSALVTTAVLLPPEKLAAVKGNLEKALGKAVELENVADPSVIGGMSVLVGETGTANGGNNISGYLIDMTIKKQISDMKERMLSVSLSGQTKI